MSDLPFWFSISMKYDEKLKFQGGYLEGILDSLKDTDFKRSELLKEGMELHDIIKMSDNEIKKLIFKKSKKRLDW